jgi:hypothetical protein
MPVCEEITKNRVSMGMGNCYQLNHGVKKDYKSNLSV